MTGVKEKLTKEEKAAQDKKELEAKLAELQRKAEQLKKEEEELKKKERVYGSCEVESCLLFCLIPYIALVPLHSSPT